MLLADVGTALVGAVVAGAVVGAAVGASVPGAVGVGAVVVGAVVVGVVPVPWTDVGAEVRGPSGDDDPHPATMTTVIANPLTAPVILPIRLIS